jgi:tetratricopeptide (TPR) repeat protein
MTAIAPQSVGIINEISARYSEGPLSEFEIAMYTKKAQAMMDNAPESAHCALGILACISGDAQKSRKHHECSLNISRSSVYLFNYGASLDILGFHDEAMDILLEAIDKDHLNTRHLNKTIKLAFRLDNRRLGELLMLWKKLNKGEEHPVEKEIASRDISRYCMESSEPSLAQVWGNCEEDAAWDYLQ